MFMNEVINVFTQTELDKSSGTEVSPNDIILAPQWYFSNCENFALKPATYYDSLKFDADDEFTAKTESMQVKYACCDYLFSYSSTLPRRNPPALMDHFYPDPVHTYPFPQSYWHSPEKNKSTKKIIYSKFHKSRSEKQNDSKNKYVYNSSSQNFGKLKFHEPDLSNFINNNSATFWTNNLEFI